MSVDSRGVRRGQCKQCSCPSYVSTDGLLCRNCRHPPAKHDNMSVIPSIPTTNTTTAGYTSSSGLPQHFTIIISCEAILCFKRVYNPLFT